jgi:hypothetical protein
LKRDGPKPKRDTPVRPGSIPQGREEERRGHALPNAPDTDDDPVEGPPIGKDEKLHGSHDT